MNDERPANAGGADVRPDCTGMGAPFYKANPNLWPVIADALTKPWPDEAIAHDLDWWADQGATGRAALPGRGELVRRWGISDWRVRAVLQSVRPTLPRASVGDWPDPDDLGIEADDATHASLCTAGYRFLQSKRGGCVVSVVEPVATAASCIPDAIGWRRKGACVLVEAKRSRADYRADDNKVTHRAGRIPGHFRWYLTPQGLIRPDELREGWGLVEVRGSRLCVVVDAPMVDPTPEAMAEAGAIHTAVTRRLASGGAIDPVTGRLSTWLGGAP